MRKSEVSNLVLTEQGVSYLLIFRWFLCMWIYSVYGCFTIRVSAIFPIKGQGNSSLRPTCRGNVVKRFRRLVAFRIFKYIRFHEGGNSPKIIPCEVKYFIFSCFSKVVKILVTAEIVPYILFLC